MPPAQVITYKPGAYCQLKLASGERILISCAQSGVKIIQLILGGLIPVRTIANWPVSRLEEAIHVFADLSKPTQHPLDAIKNKLIGCSSIADVEKLCGLVIK